MAETNEDILIRAWQKDRYTSALLEQQRGTAPALPVNVTGNAEWNNFVLHTGELGRPYFSNMAASDQFYIADNAQAIANAKSAFDNNTLNATATTFDINDLRLAFQIQKFLERNNRAGARYTEFLKAHFGVNPRDDRLQRPEYIGGSRAPVIISEVLQTSETATTPQGTLAGLVS